MFQPGWLLGSGLARRFASVAVVSLGLGAVVACSQEPVTQSQTDASEPASAPESRDRPRVVATSSVLCDLTEQVAQDTLELTCLLAPGQDPHTYQAKPSDRQAIEAADLILYGGYGAAPALQQLIEASTTAAPKVAVFEAAVPEPLMGSGHDHEHDAHGTDEGEDHSHEVADAAEVTQVADPHVWHHALNNGAIARVIANYLAQIAPDQAEFYETQAADLAQQFTALHAWIQEQVATIAPENRKLVTSHDAFRYFATAYGFEIEGALSGLSTAEEPSAATLTRLVGEIKAARVPAIFAESTANPDLIKTVARTAGVEVAARSLLVEGPDDDAKTTQEMLVVNTCTLVVALGGTCNEATAPR